MGRFLFWIILLAAIGFGAYVYLKDPDPATYQANATQAASDLYAGAVAFYGRAKDAYQNASSDASESNEDDEAAVNDESAEEPALVVESAASDDQTAPEPSSDAGGSEDSLDQYRAWISEARAMHPYSDSEERMYAVMMCESEGRATIVNQAGPYSGLFQYSSATWNGDWNTYRDQDILDPRAQIFATALAWSLGMQGHWGCYSRSH